MSTETVELMSNELVPALKNATDLVIATELQYNQAGEMLKLVKIGQRGVTDVMDPLCDTTNKAHKKTTSTRNEKLKPWISAEKIIKGKMLDYSGKNEVQKLDGISTADSWDAVIVDEAKIPRKYMLPDIKTLKAIAKASKDTIKIPGVDFVNNRSMSARV